MYSINSFIFIDSNNIAPHQNTTNYFSNTVNYVKIEGMHEYALGGIATYEAKILLRMLIGPIRDI
jgi:hypothetical protein